MANRKARTAQRGTSATKRTRPILVLNAGRADGFFIADAAPRKRESGSGATAGAVALGA